MYETCHNMTRYDAAKLKNNRVSPSQMPKFFTLLIKTEKYDVKNKITQQYTYLLLYRIMCVYVLSENKNCDIL